MNAAPLWVRTLRQKWIYLTQIKISDHGSHNRVKLGLGHHRRIKVMFVGSGNTVEIGPDAEASNITISICGSNNVVRLGERLKMNDGWVQVFGDNSSLEAASDCWMMNTAVYVTDSGAKVFVGSGTKLGPGCELRCGDGHALYDLSSGEIFNRARFLHIGDRVWVGAGVLFLKDVTVGDGAIIGSRSVVTKAVPEKSLAVGVPAKVIRHNVGWTRERIDELPGDWFRNRS